MSAEPGAEARRPAAEHTAKAAAEARPKTKAEGQPIRIDHTFREKLGLILEGDGVNYCYQCGACVGDCPSARFSERFNPRNIMLAVLYGMEEEVVGPQSPIWMCSNCFTCFDRCPQQVKPIEVIIAIKNLMGRMGVAPEGLDRLIQGIVETGRSALITAFTERRRMELGLPRLEAVPVDEIKTLLEGLEGTGIGARRDASGESE